MFNDLNQDSKLFFRFFRVSPERFYHLLSLIEGKIFKDTLMWKAISPAEKLSLTLSFLATGECQQFLSFAFCAVRSTVMKTTCTTCDAIYDSLKQIYLSLNLNII